MAGQIVTVIIMQAFYKAAFRHCFGRPRFLGRNCEFNVTGSVHIGDNALIASGCKFIDHDHGDFTRRDDEHAGGRDCADCG